MTDASWSRARHLRAGIQSEKRADVNTHRTCVNAKRPVPGRWDGPGRQEKPGVGSLQDTGRAGPGRPGAAVTQIRQQSHAEQGADASTAPGAHRTGVLLTGQPWKCEGFCPQIPARPRPLEAPMKRCREVCPTSSFSRRALLRSQALPRTAGGRQGPVPKTQTTCARYPATLPSRIPGLG